MKKITQNQKFGSPKLLINDQIFKQQVSAFSKPNLQRIVLSLPLNKMMGSSTTKFTNNFDLNAQIKGTLFFFLFSRLSPLISYKETLKKAGYSFSFKVSLTKNLVNDFLVGLFIEKLSPTTAFYPKLSGFAFNFSVKGASLVGMEDLLSNLYEELNPELTFLTTIVPVRVGTNFQSLNILSWVSNDSVRFLINHYEMEVEVGPTLELTDKEIALAMKRTYLNVRPGSWLHFCQLTHEKQALIYYKQNSLVYKWWIIFVKLPYYWKPFLINSLLELWLRLLVLLDIVLVSYASWCFLDRWGGLVCGLLGPYTIILKWELGRFGTTVLMVLWTAFLVFLFYCLVRTGEIKLPFFC